MRCTLGERRLLHYQVWEDARGPVPAGHELTFIDGDIHNCALGNLLLLDKQSMRQRHATGENQFTRSAGARLKLLMGNFESGEPTLAAALQR